MLLDLDAFSACIGLPSVLARGILRECLFYHYRSKGLFSTLRDIDRIEFEGLNFNLGNIYEVIKAVAAVYPI
ncbi:MAG: hypothetical protein WC335_05635 [Candidatus Omnitrophota bacterium]